MRYLKLLFEKKMEFLEALKAYGTLYAPVRISEKSFDYKPVDRVEDIQFRYNRTVLPPRKYFFPPEESMFRFDKKDCRLTETYEDSGPFVIFGMHACDIIGLRILDSRFIDDQPDPYYKRRRENGIVIGLDCEPDEYCFCNVRDADFADTGFDLFLHELDDGFLIRVGSVQGHKIVDSILDLFVEITARDIDVMTRREKEKEAKFVTNDNWDNLRYMLELKDGHRMWARESEKCISCGNCTLTCPTCRCYDVQDLPELDGNGGRRVRFWDSCQYREHGLVAGGHNFRETKLDRFKNRYQCKNAYCESLTLSYCVGCGRCSQFCPTGINYRKNLTEIRGIE